MPRITISYRREDSDDITGRIYDRLKLHYGADSVFRDIDRIPLGVNFRHYIDEEIQKTDFLLVVIGPRWLGQREGGPDRILDRNDPVRVEVGAALRHGLTVIPLLVGRATMPGPDVLPEDLQELADINGAEISSGRDFEHHVDGVVRAIEGSIAARAKDQRAEAERAEDERRRIEEAARKQLAQTQEREREQRAEQERQLRVEHERLEAARRAAERDRQQSERVTIPPAPAPKLSRAVIGGAAIAALAVLVIVVPLMHSKGPPPQPTVVPTVAIATPTPKVVVVEKKIYVTPAPVLRTPSRSQTAIPVPTQPGQYHHAPAGFENFSRTPGLWIVKTSYCSNAVIALTFYNDYRTTINFDLYVQDMGKTAIKADASKAVFMKRLHIGPASRQVALTHAPCTSYTQSFGRNVRFGPADTGPYF